MLLAANREAAPLAAPNKLVGAVTVLGYSFLSVALGCYIFYVDLAGCFSTLPNNDDVPVIFCWDKGFYSFLFPFTPWVKAVAACLVYFVKSFLSSLGLLVVIVDDGSYF